MNGLGRIFQRGPVFWVAYYHRGKEYRESSHSESEAQAKRLLKKRLGEIGRGRLIGPVEEKVTFEEMAQDFLKDYEINGMRSFSAARLSVRHLRAFFGLDRALDITTDRVRGYISYRQDEGASNGSINRELAALKRMFSLAVQAGKLSGKPYIPALEENNARQGFLDHGSFLALKKNLPDHLKDPVGFLYLSGWRVSEMRTLHWRDVDLAGKIVRLRPEISKNKNGRVLPLAGELLEIIERAKTGRRLDCAFVFHFNSRPIGDFRKAWQTACVAAGLGQFMEGERSAIQSDALAVVDDDQPKEKPEYRKRGRKRYVGTIPHDLRRCAIRNMVRAGIPERVAMALSGHKTRSVFDRYNIVSEADLAEGAERLHAHLQKQPQVAAVAVKKAV